MSFQTALQFKNRPRFLASLHQEMERTADPAILAVETLKTLDDFIQSTLLPAQTEVTFASALTQLFEKFPFLLPVKIKEEAHLQEALEALVIEALMKDPSESNLHFLEKLDLKDPKILFQTVEQLSTQDQVRVWDALSQSSQ